MQVLSWGPTQPHKSLNSKFDHIDKRLLSLHRERVALYRRMREKVRLETPIQRGWMRCYFLTLEAEQRSEAPLLKEILKKINSPRYHWRKNFVPTKRYRRPQVQRMEQPLGSLSPSDWLREACPATWKLYFLGQYYFQQSK